MATIKLFNTSTPHELFANAGLDPHWLENPANRVAFKVEEQVDSEVMYVDMKKLVPDWYRNKQCFEHIQRKASPGLNRLAEEVKTSGMFIAPMVTFGVHDYSNKGKKDAKQMPHIHYGYSTAQTCFYYLHDKLDVMPVMVCKDDAAWFKQYEAKFPSFPQARDFILDNEKDFERVVDGMSKGRLLGEFVKSRGDNFEFLLPEPAAKMEELYEQKIEIEPFDSSCSLTRWEAPGKKTTFKILWERNISHENILLTAWVMNQVEKRHLELRRA